MQETNINFTGISLTPYSDVSPDSQLSACVGLEFHGGSLRPSVIGGTKYTLPDDGKQYRLDHVHSTSAYSHFIFSAANQLYWADAVEGALKPTSVGTFQDLLSVNTVGNTLVVLTAKGLYYCLWTGNGYKYIGQQPPEIGLSFGLSLGTVERASTAGTIKLTASAADYMTEPTRQFFISEKEDQRTYVTNVVWEAINKAIEGCTQNNLFCMPFFVRAAYRRFDGSYTMLTPPVLMIPDSTGPKARFNVKTWLSDGMNGEVLGSAIGARLLMMASSSFQEDLSNWTDIISSIDIFVSPQVMRADNSQLVYILYGEEKFESSLTWHKPPYSYSVGRFQDTSYFTKTEFDWELENGLYKFFKLPLKDEEAFLQDVNGSVSFYKVRSIPLSKVVELSSSTLLPVIERSIVLSNLPQMESLPDSSDYQSHDTISASRSHVYNQRLHLFDINRTLFGGFSPEVMWPHTDSVGSNEVVVSVYVSAEDGSTRIVRTVSPFCKPYVVGRFLYYPDPNATRMLITMGSLSYDIPLQPHPLLNGAYYLFMDTEPTAVSSGAPAVYNPPIVMSNKVYTSEVGNPFYFPLEGIYTVGTGQIYGLSSVATALSQGQFGQFPLMIFCSDGNYAMSVNDEGRYSAIHPMQRDVCVNPNAIVQMDSEVLFISSRGVMITSGASANCISSELDGVPDTLPPQFEEWLHPSGHPSDFFKSCRVAYDYTNRRLIFFPSDGAVCWIYSIEGAFWSTGAWGAIISAVNVFPYSYIQASDRNIYMLSDGYGYAGETESGLIFTRPVKLGSFSMKKIHSISVQGIFSSDQKISVYGSNDARTWQYLGTSDSSEVVSMPGRTFKYWRFAIETSLSPAENISAIRIHYEVRKERRMR